MEKKIIGLSREMIIHPCETLKEMLENKSMSQNELAQRAGVTPKHISTILSGEKNITPSFAKKLEYVFGITASFWMNLQLQYDKELLEFEEINSITKEEHNIEKKLKEIIFWFKSNHFISADSFSASLVLSLRKILGVSNLVDVKSFTYSGAFRAQTKKNVDVDILFAWQKICELSAESIQIQDFTQKEQNQNLLNILPLIKSCMFLQKDDFIIQLQTLFARCGITFVIAPHFKGAPVQGFIKKTESGKTLLCMTFRQKNAGIFWFTLFHEIAHILHGDVKTSFVDFESVENEIEKKADDFAQSQLLHIKNYREFIQTADFSYTAIAQFAQEQKVPPFIVIGRLKHDKKISWSALNDKVVMYE